MKEAVTDAQQRPGFPLRSLRSLHNGNENRGQLFALRSSHFRVFPSLPAGSGVGLCLYI